MQRSIIGSHPPVAEHACLTRDPRFCPPGLLRPSAGHIPCFADRQSSNNNSCAGLRLSLRLPPPSPGRHPQPSDPHRAGCVAARFEFKHTAVDAEDFSKGGKYEEYESWYQDGKAAQL